MNEPGIKPLLKTHEANHKWARMFDPYDVTAAFTNLDALVDADVGTIQAPPSETMLQYMCMPACRAARTQNCRNFIGRVNNDALRACSSFKCDWHKKLRRLEYSLCHMLEQVRAPSVIFTFTRIELFDAVTSLVKHIIGLVYAYVQKFEEDVNSSLLLKAGTITASALQEYSDMTLRTPVWVPDIVQGSLRLHNTLNALTSEWVADTWPGLHGAFKEDLNDPKKCASIRRRLQKVANAPPWTKRRAELLNNFLLLCNMVKVAYVERKRADIHAEDKRMQELQQIFSTSVSLLHDALVHDGDVEAQLGQMTQQEKKELFEVLCYACNVDDRADWAVSEVAPSLLLYLDRETTFFGTRHGIADGEILNEETRATMDGIRKRAREGRCEGLAGRLEVWR